jgi:hypothetical protein
MNIKAIAALAVFSAVPALTALPAHADDYTCDSGPCIVKADRYGKYKVKIVWSGQGTSYNHYKLNVTPHGGGDGKDLKLKGGQGGKATINLKHEGDWELVLYGCDKSEDQCERSSEKVRMNLY